MRFLLPHPLTPSLSHTHTHILSLSLSLSLCLSYTYHMLSQSGKAISPVCEPHSCLSLCQSGVRGNRKGSQHRLKAALNVRCLVMHTITPVEHCSSH